MSLPSAPGHLLTQTSQGLWRIAGTRISLDSIVHAFWDGAAPEEMCQDFPSLTLVQVYGVIAYYLNHREQVDDYLREQSRSEGTIREELQNKHGRFLSELRQRLLVHRERTRAA